MERQAKVKICGLYAIYLLLLLFGLHQQPTFALFEYCDHEYNLSPGVAYVESPYYPDYYPSSTSCRYKFVAPLDYNITIDCVISLEKNPSSCSTEFFYVASDGDTQLRQSEQFCGDGRIQRTSLFRTMTLAYASYGQKGRFRCSLTVSPQPCDCGWSINTRITNGQETNINEFPSMVAIKDRDSNLPSFCDGVIISHLYILTAAHCIFFQPTVSKLIILVGDHSLTTTGETRYAATYDVAQVIVHPNFNSEANTNDIGLIRTTTNIEWSRGAGPICLPSIGASSQTFNYEVVTLLGWGTSAFGGVPSPTLQKIDQMILPNSNCQSEYQNLAVITSNHICTYDYRGTSGDTCQYDSGGPVILRRSRQFLIGCISFGRGCGYNQYPVGINTRITSYINWILSQVGSGRTCVKALQ